MPSYIGKVQISGGDPVLIGSTLYGICTTAANEVAKTVGTTDNNSGKFINNSYDNLIQGTTIHVKFTQGNTVATGMTLAVGSTIAKNIVGTCTCPAGTIISFTLDENENWVANDNVDTNTEYEFMTAYNASTNKVATASDLTALNIQDAAHKDIVTDIGANTTSADLPTAAAVAAYVQAQTGGLSGLTGAMHFRGVATIAITDGGTENPTIQNYTFNGNGDNAGDVVLWNQQEYVWTGTAWELLGDEGSYVMKSSQTTDTIDEVTTWTDGTLPQLTVTDTQVSNTTASVSAGILNISLTPVTVGSASGWNAGVMPTLAQTPTTVVVPAT